MKGEIKYKAGDRVTIRVLPCEEIHSEIAGYGIGRDFATADNIRLRDWCDRLGIEPGKGVVAQIVKLESDDIDVLADDCAPYRVCITAKGISDINVWVTRAAINSSTTVDTRKLINVGGF